MKATFKGFLKSAAVLAGLGVLLPGAAFGQPSQPEPPWGWPGPWHMWWGGGWGFGWIFPLIMMALMIFLVALLMRGFMGPGHSHRDSTSSALRLLNERFAKGEISKEEFQEKREILGRRV